MASLRRPRYDSSAPKTLFLFLYFRNPNLSLFLSNRRRCKGSPPLAPSSPLFMLLFVPFIVGSFLLSPPLLLEARTDVAIHASMWANLTTGSIRFLRWCVILRSPVPSQLSRFGALPLAAKTNLYNTMSSSFSSMAHSNRSGGRGRGQEMKPNRERSRGRGGGKDKIDALSRLLLFLAAVIIFGVELLGWVFEHFKAGVCRKITLAKSTVKDVLGW